MTSPLPHLQFEENFGRPQVVVIGVDEVGRGCLAGPVMAGAYVVPHFESGHAPSWLSQVRDSKLLSPGLRASLSPLLEAWSPHWAVGEASVEEIDRFNILNAVELAMKRAVDQVLTKLDSISPSPHILVDGNRIPKPFVGKATAIIKGDQQSLSIACASIIAKVRRDHVMEELDRLHPGYGLAVHKGYGTAVHLKALKELSAASVHRRSFGPVKSCLG